MLLILEHPAGCPSLKVQVRVQVNQQRELSTDGLVKRPGQTPFQTPRESPLPSLNPQVPGAWVPGFRMSLNFIHQPTVLDAITAAAASVGPVT